MLFHHFIQQTAHIRKRNFIAQESSHGNLIGSVECTRYITTQTNRIKSIREIGESFEIRAFEGQGGSREIHPRIIVRDAVGNAKGITDRQTHIGNTKLSLDRTIAELHHGVYYALWVHEYFDLIGLHLKQPFGFDHLKPLVHERSRIDSHLCPHIPIRMAESLFTGSMLQFLCCQMQKRASRSRQQDLLRPLSLS